MNDKQKVLLTIMICIGCLMLITFAGKVTAAPVGPINLTATDKNKVNAGVQAQEFVYDPTHKILAIIGSKSQTRISFGSIGIREVVGDNNKYSMVHDTLGMSIFISSKVKVGETINLTIISNGGKFQDISLSVKDGEGKVILIRETNKASENTVIAKISIGTQKLNEAKDMLKAMVLGVRSKYDVTTLFEEAKPTPCAKCSSSRVRGNSNRAGILVAFMPVQDNHNNGKSLVGQGLEIRETHVYKYKLGKIKGIALEIKNKTKEPWQVKTNLLSKMFRGVLLTNIETQVIPANTTIYSFVVMNDEVEV